MGFGRILLFSDILVYYFMILWQVHYKIWTKKIMLLIVNLDFDTLKDSKIQGAKH